MLVVLIHHTHRNHGGSMALITVHRHQSYVALYSPPFFKTSSYMSVYNHIIVQWCSSTQSCCSGLYLHLHVGGFPDHWPFGWQRRVISPSSINPILQLYMALDPGVVPITMTIPFTGSANGPQFTAAYQKNHFFSYYNVKFVYSLVPNAFLPFIIWLFTLKYCPKTGQLEGLGMRITLIDKVWKIAVILLSTSISET